MPALNVTRVRAQMDKIVGIKIPIDHMASRVHGGVPFRIHYGHLAAVAVRILVGDALNDLVGCQSLLEQRHRLRSVGPIRGSLGGDGANTGNCPRNRGSCGHGP